MKPEPELYSVHFAKMYIRHILHTEEDLAARFCQRFLRRWQRLLCVYKEHHWRLTETEALRCADVAWALFSAVTEGKSGMIEQTGRILDNESREVIEVGDTTLFTGDGSKEVMLTWDALCLMLEEIEPLDEWQYAFDIASPHATMAYKAEVMDEVEEAVVVEEKPAEVSKVLTTTMSEEVMQKATDNSELTAFIAECVAVLERKSLEERQKGCHVLMRMVVERDIPLPPDLRERLVHLDDEKPQPTTLVFKDHSSYNPNAKDVNYYGK